jgi:outer membrane immunogenic protein
MHARAMGILAATAAIGFASTPAITADLNVPGPNPPALAPIPAPYDWSGFFVGGHVGYGWSAEAIALTPFGPYPAGTIPAAIAANANGFVGGVQYGTNWQLQRLVLGTESDFSFAGIRGSGLTATHAANRGEQKLPFFGTTRVRAGYAVEDNVLVYATGGLANGRAETDFSAAGPGVATFGSKRRTLWGWGAGAGIEYGMGPWSAKIEYLHFDLGTETFYAFDARTSGAFTRVSTRFAGDMVRAGVEYRFAWSPWQILFGK